MKPPKIKGNSNPKRTKQYHTQQNYPLYLHFDTFLIDESKVLGCSKVARVSEVGPLEVSKQLISLMTKKNVRFLMQKCGVSGSQMLIGERGHFTKHTEHNGNETIKEKSVV